MAVRKILFYAALMAIAVLSPAPAAAMPETNISDKLSHVAAYAVLCLLGLAAYPGRRMAPWVVTGVLFYGALMEGLQAFSPGRSMEAADMLANATGVLAGVLLALVAGWLRRTAAK